MLAADGELQHEYAITPRAHTRYLPIMMDAVLQRANINKSQLTHIAFANGPGAFTGVRIAAATAQGLSIGLGCPLLGISTLAVLAQHAANVSGKKRILAALDARMGEAYAGLYQFDEIAQTVNLVASESLMKLQELQTPADCFLAGSGFQARRDAGLPTPEHNIDAQMLPQAKALAQLAAQALNSGATAQVGEASINYLRNQVAEKSTRKPL